MAVPTPANPPVPPDPMARNIAVAVIFFIFGLALLIIGASIWVWVLWARQAPVPVPDLKGLTSQEAQAIVTQYKDLNTAVQARMTAVYNDVVVKGLLALMTTVISAGIIATLIKPATEAIHAFAARLNRS